MSGATSRTIRTAMQPLSPFLSFLQSYQRLVSDPSDPNVCDFCFGNPHEMPLPEITEALIRWATPQHQMWFAYKTSEPAAVDVVRTSLVAHHGIDFEAPDIFLTNGAFAAITCALRAVLDAGDEVIYLSPPWFFYRTIILAYGGVPVRVDIRPKQFDLPVDAIAAALTPRTRAVIVNSPHNPSGRIFPAADLERLGALLEEASSGRERPIYLLSDEAYSRILFDGNAFRSPLHHYRRAILLYTYGKTLLAPGQRVGYIALPPHMPDREELRDAIFTAQTVTGFAWPNALMQYALGDLEKASIDIAALQRRRDRVVAELGAMGYETVSPEGTFYVLVRSPLGDDEAFTSLLAADGVYVLPGAVFELPGWFRISLTANDHMVERSLPGFRRAIDAAAVQAVS
jgi:aspartate aminotransferase